MNIPKYMGESTVLKMTDNRNVFKDGLLWGANHVGLRAVFVTDSRGHELFITSAHKLNMENLKTHLNDKSFIDRIRKQSESKGVNEIRMDYFVFDISNVGSENVFAYNMQIMRQVHLMSIARNCFHEFNFELPVSMSRYTIESLWELDQMRISPRVSESMRETWNETYTKAVKNAYLFYQPEYYSKEDYSMVRAIQNRLGEEMNTYEPSSKKAIEAAKNQELLQKKEGMDI